MPRRLLVLLPALAVGLLLLASPAAAHGKPECPPVGDRQVDPIVSRGTATSEHLHTFMGNQRLLQLPQPELATWQDLVSQATSCENPADSAAGWVPKAYRDGQGLQPHRNIWYYRPWDRQAGSVGARPFPADLRMVVSYTNITCSDQSSRKGPYRTVAEANCGTATGKVFLIFHYDFPSCWDGQLNGHTTLGDTIDFNDRDGLSAWDHLRYTTAGKGKNGGVCPAGFGVKLPALRFTIGYGDGTATYWGGHSFALSSGADTTAHADYWVAWDPAGQARFVDVCGIDGTAAADHHLGANVAVCGA